MSRKQLLEQNYPHPHAKILNSCFASINQHTVPLYKPRGTAIRSWGSGTLLQIADRYWLSTAAHVVDDLLNRRLPFFLPPRESEGKPYSLLPRSIASYPMRPGVSNRNDDPVDICLVELQPEAAEHLRARRKFATLDDLGSSDSSAEGMYLLGGYPLEHEVYREEECLSLTGSRHYVTELHEEMLSQDRINQFQILLKYPRDLLVTSDGSEPRYPEPSGISGCGVWKLTPKPPSEWTLKDRKLVAVQHGHARLKQQLQATRSELLVKLLIQSYPELRDVIEDGLKCYFGPT